MEIKRDQAFERRTALVLLAAGDSRRFGGNKLLSDFEGKKMYRHITEQIGRLPEDYFARKILVTQYRELAEDLAGEGYEVVENHDSALGISHSVHLALEALDAADTPGTPGPSGHARVEAVCFAVCDQPWLTAESVAGLIAGRERSGRGLGCLAWGDALGNPAVFTRAYFPELLALTGDTGGKRVLRRHPDDLYRHEAAEERELKDIDVRGGGL